MLIWTIQTLPAWEKLQRDGCLYGPGADLVCSLDNSWQWRNAYAWMVEQMECRIGQRPRPDIFALWGWYQWRDAVHRKPDLRSSGHLATGIRGVRLYCEIPDQQVLLSDFMLWHHVLNYGYLALNEAEDEAFQAEMVRRGTAYTGKEPLADSFCHQKILESWQRIFDLDCMGDPDWLGEQARDKRTIQGTFWQLTLDQVRDVTVFTSR